MKLRRPVLWLVVAAAFNLLLTSPLQTGVTTEQRQKIQEMINRGDRWKGPIKNERAEAIKSRNGWQQTGDPGLLDDYWGHQQARRAYEESLKVNRDSVIDSVDAIYGCGIPPGTDVGYDPYCGSKNDGTTYGYCSARCFIRLCEPAFKDPDEIASTKIHEGKHAQQKVDGHWGPGNIPRECTVVYHWMEWEAYNAELDADFGCTTKLSKESKDFIAKRKEYHTKAAHLAAWLEEMSNSEFDIPALEFPKPDSTVKRSVTVTNDADYAQDVMGHFENEFGWFMFPVDFSFFLESEQETTFDFVIKVPPEAEIGTANEVLLYTYTDMPSRAGLSTAWADTIPQDFIFIVVSPTVEVTAGPDVQGAAGSLLDFYFTVENTGAVRDTFSVLMTSMLGWPLSSESWTVPLDPTESVELHNSVELADSMPLATDLILCEAVSMSDPVQSDSSWLDVMVSAEAGIDDGPEYYVFALMPNVPNPFTGSTIIRFSIPSSCPVELKIYDVRGRLVRTLIDPGRGAFEAGIHTVKWEGRDERGHSVASGVYFYKLTASKRTASRKLVLLR